MNEPQIHSHITDSLPDDHNLRNEEVFCDSCNKMIHAFNNECMSTWVETGVGNFCIECFARIDFVDALDEKYGVTK